MFCLSCSKPLGCLSHPVPRLTHLPCHYPVPSCIPATLHLLVLSLFHVSSVIGLSLGLTLRLFLPLRVKDRYMTSVRAGPPMSILGSPSGLAISHFIHPTGSLSSRAFIFAHDADAVLALVLYVWLSLALRMVLALPPMALVNSNSSPKAFCLLALSLLPLAVSLLLWHCSLESLPLCIC